MLWIIPLILFIAFLFLYIYYVYTRKINKKLIKKQRYYNKVPKLRVNFATNCRITFMVCFGFLVVTFAFFVIPHTNGTIKDLNNYEDLVNLYDNYYVEEQKVEEYENAKVIANTIKSTKAVQQKVSFDYKSLAYIENNILYLKKLDGSKLSCDLKDDIIYDEVAICKDKVLVYSKGESSMIRIYSFETLELIEKIHINGEIQLLTVDGDKLCLAVKHTLSEDALISEEVSQKEIRLNFEDIHYDINSQFYQNITFITINSDFNYDMFSLCIGEYYLFDTKSSIFIVSNSINEENKFNTSVYLYDKALGFLSRKVNLNGYTYTEPELDKNKIKIYTFEKIMEDDDEISIFHEFELNLSLLLKKDETAKTQANNKEILIILDEENVLAQVKENKLTLSKDLKDSQVSMSIDMNECDLEIIEDEIYLISDNGQKIIEKINVNEDGFEKVEVFSYEKLENFQLVYSYYDTNANFIFASNNEVVIVGIKENSFELTNVYSSDIEQFKISIVDKQIILIFSQEVLVYDINDKKFVEIDIQVKEKAQLSSETEKKE